MNFRGKDEMNQSSEFLAPPPLFPSRPRVDLITCATRATAVLLFAAAAIAWVAPDSLLSVHPFLPAGAAVTILLALWGRNHRRLARHARQQNKINQQKYLDAHDRARLMELAASAGDSLLVIADRFGHIQWVNDRFTKTSGYRLDQAVGSKLANLVNGPNTDPQTLAYIQKQFALGKSFRCQIVNRTRDGRDYWVDMNVQPVFDDQGLTHWISVETDITHDKQTEQRLRHDATHDTLTGLANRANMIERLTLALSRKRREKDHLFALLFLDLDRFKLINDSMGHAVGDGLLIEVSNRLRQSVRDVDAVAHNDRRVVARFGGDEFILLLDEISDAADAVRVAQRVLDSLAAPYKIDGIDISTSASIGIAICDDPALEAQDILRNADLAMYQAKNAGKARYAIFDQAMHDYAVDRLELEADLKNAVRADDQISVVYQPVVHVAKQKLVGFEALVRWNHPTRGPISPEQFVTIAEETGLIHKLGQKVLWESCRQLKQWHDLGGSAEELTIVADR
jgi:diguanylate cyclase (GGDEF)-like protein/PAS domain S-box-containing protein